MNAVSFAFRSFLAAALATASLAAVAQRLPPARSDAYGYTIASTAGECAYHPVDVSASAPLALTAAEGSNAAADDGFASIALAAPFELYGVATSTLVASSNGYLAAADGSVDDGGDFSNDCPLPAVPDHVAGRAGRILAYHDDLAAGSAGALRSAYFTACPRPAEAGGTQPCTVVEWRDWTRLGQPGALTVQAVLYHASFEIVVQHLTLDATAGSGATVGLHNAAADSAAEFACNGSRPLAPATATCFFDPRFPAGEAPIFKDGFD